jgi:hypothetical protein
LTFGLRLAGEHCGAATGQVVTFQQFLLDIQAARDPASLASTCIRAIPDGASQPAIDYLRAVNSDCPEWVQATNMIKANGNQANLAIVQAESRVDAQFLLQLRAIHFTGAAAQPAAALETAVSTYLSDLAKGVAANGLETPALNSEFKTVDTERADASSALREALGLQQSSCVVLRP